MNLLGRIDFTTAAENELQHLASLCEPATFGMNDQDVYDETYRKTGQLDAAYFAAKFDPQCCGLLDAIRGDLMEGDYEKPIRAELYKLNVYGPGSFFEAHQDTTRGQDMFGSLVLIFPAKHEGGALVLRHEGSEWRVDSATTLATSETPSVGYVAFFSDVEHEVSPVVSGYRVTVTYNLYYADTDTSGCNHEDHSAARDPPANEAAFLAGLRALLEDESCMPAGGTLCSGLRHQYPCARQNPQTNCLWSLERRLKGSDAMLRRICDALGLEASIRVVYETGNGALLLDDIVNFGDDFEHHEEDVVSCLQDRFGRKVLQWDDCEHQENIALA
ncbi:hypothetical protein OBBRIDRAFT_778903 [Obba rivulosa]|uniref:Fe2OG dioxygenase domain-containing protein n=1 Tax=Obba rivulosa TaxID=1052685 RepID=A0A8E2DJC1_9APHY|nr:hypothetical protein OBBRIDRAFT_778903 [Obba rivulosa]